MGNTSGLPYVAHVDEYTSLRTSWRFIASNNPTVLTVTFL